MQDEIVKATYTVLTELDRVFDHISVQEVVKLCRDIQKANKIFVVGVGRVELALQAFAKRLGHLGYSVHCVGEVCEPAIQEGDLLIVGSGSGKSLFPVAIAKKAYSLGAKVIQIGSEYGDLDEIASYQINIPTVTKTGQKANKVESHQIMTSLFEQTLWLLGDIVCLALLKESGKSLEELWKYHANLE